MLKLTVNGEPHEHKGDGALVSLLREIGTDPRQVAIAINDAVVNRQDIKSMQLVANDRVEIMVFAGGG
jgi:thiamine biosynthesis protein ThiS